MSEPTSEPTIEPTIEPFEAVLSQYRTAIDRLWAAQMDHNRNRTGWGRWRSLRQVLGQWRDRSRSADTARSADTSRSADTERRYLRNSPSLSPGRSPGLSLDKSTTPGPDPAPAETEAHQILALLRLRDTIEPLLTPETSGGPTNEQLLELFALDDQLRSLAAVLHRHAPLEQWRDRLRPSEQAWWWYMEHPRDRYDWLWSALTLVFLTIGGSFALSITMRILASEAFWLGSLTLVGQSVLTLATAGGTLTETGRLAIEKILGKTGLGRQLWQEVKVGLASGLAIVLWGVHTLVLPGIAKQALETGKQLLGVDRDRSDLAAARVQLARAVALDPDNSEAHYFLGLAYQLIQNFDEAKNEYQKALSDDSVAAYSALGFLYIKEDKLNEAYTLLFQGKMMAQKIRVQQTSVSLETRYALDKNLGWLYLKRKSYDEAEAVLDEAIEKFDQLKKTNPQAAKNTGGYAYCLQAEVIESTRAKTEAHRLWSLCSQWANPRFPEQAVMLEKASDRLIN